MTAPMTPEQVAAARASIAALRDEAREYGRMPFKVRDEHVMRLHRQLDAITTLQAEVATLRQRVADLTAEAEKAEAAITDWVLVADGVKHDWRCVNHCTCCTEGATPCLRCRLATAEAVLARVTEQRNDAREAFEMAHTELATLRAQAEELERAAEQGIHPAEREVVRLREALADAIDWHESQRSNEPGESPRVDGWRAAIAATEQETEPR